ncbi:PH domain-like protein [Basidiobolus meristosporus CBS 931.73]|uniref:PH domain-like protein n=1 Tax=Basidiobolus meristosporus CBS 931.73 TaxID=1314790 RepID=A0A1Y1Z3Y2_9FUNG|nr:PH domain-like protein [Basidiobolus meristosporus CBS 931.73]|eukprot:ORY04988.1 PH domain-like protein [Basidiobolus meristosporus CBS 931.73]
MLEITSKITYPLVRETDEIPKPRVTFAASFNPQNPSTELTAMNSPCEEDSHQVVPSNVVGEVFSQTTHARNRTTEEIDNQTLIKYGYLLKRSTKRKVWRKRWLVLRGTSLACYKDNKEYELERIIDLSEAKQILEVTWKSRKNVFAIIVEKKKYYLQAESRTQLDEWLSSMDFVLSGLAEDDIPEEPTHIRKGSSVSRTSIHGKSGVDHPKVCTHSLQRKIHVPSHGHAAEVVSSEDDEEADEVVDEDEEVEFPQSSDSKILFNGYLYKQCEMYKVWRKRWFVLRSHTLSYYKNEKEYVLHKIIPIESIQGAFEKNPTNIKNKRFCFQLITPQRNYLVATEDQEYSLTWLRAINTAIQQAKSEHEQV